MPASKSRGRRKLGHTYIRLHLNFDSSKLKASGDLFIEALDSALTTLYGCIGGALNWDLVKFQNEIGIATIQCQRRDEERIWAAASFLTQVRGSPCRLQVLESSPSLLPAAELPHSPHADLRNVLLLTCAQFLRSPPDFNLVAK